MEYSPGTTSRRLDSCNFFDCLMKSVLQVQVHFEAVEKTGILLQFPHQLARIQFKANRIENAVVKTRPDEVLASHLYFRSRLMHGLGLDHWLGLGLDRGLGKVRGLGRDVLDRFAHDSTWDLQFETS